MKIGGIIFVVVASCVSSSNPKAYDHMCDDPKNKIECDEWKNNHPKEYQRYLDKKEKNLRDSLQQSPNQQHEQQLD